jgi:hypothetical protein
MGLFYFIESGVNMSCTNTDISMEIVDGVAYYYQIIYKGVEAQASIGFPDMSLTGYSCALALKDSDNVTVYAMTNGNGRIIMPTPPTNTFIILRFPGATTAAWDVGILKGDLDIITPDSRVEERIKVSIEVRA